MPTNLKGINMSEAQLAVAHERWYADQPQTRCRRCDQEFINVDHGKTEYCSRDCELGFLPASSTTDSEPARVVKDWF